MTIGRFWDEGQHDSRDERCKTEPKKALELIDDIANMPHCSTPWQ